MTRAGELYLLSRRNRETNAQEVSLLDFNLIIRGENCSKLVTVPKRLGLMFGGRVCRSETLNQSTQQDIHANLTARAPCSVQQKGPSDSQHGFSSLETGN